MRLVYEFFFTISLISFAYCSKTLVSSLKNLSNHFVTCVIVNQWTNSDTSNEINAEVSIVESIYKTFVYKKAHLLQWANNLGKVVN